MDDNQPSKIIEIVQKRTGFFELLSEGINDKRNIEEELGVSRSTVNRTLSELDQLGMVEADNGDLDLTLYGELSYQQYQ